MATCYVSNLDWVLTDPDLDPFSETGFRCVLDLTGMGKKGPDPDTTVCK